MAIRSKDPSNVLNDAINAQKQLMKGYERPGEVLTFETVRSLDEAYCRELFPDRNRRDEHSEIENGIMAWGVNHALGRIIPETYADGPFKLHPSNPSRQAQAHNFLFDCGCLAEGERLLDWLRDGLISGVVRDVRKDGFEAFSSMLVLKTASSSAYSEAIGRRGVRWSSTQATEQAGADERDLERRHRDLLPDLDRRVDVFDGWGMAYKSDPEIDAYFLEWGRLYLRRMIGSEMIAPEQTIGGLPFARYLEALAVLAGRAQKQLCFAGLLQHRRPDLMLRNLLTTFTSVDELVSDVAHQLGVEALEAQRILAHLTLSPTNRTLHTGSGDTTWAPLVQASTTSVILPLYGLEINPFLFLLNDLRGKYPGDWSSLANSREARWIEQLRAMFPGPRWRVSARGVKLRDRKRDVTDVDFAAYDTETGELALLQLKWQQPVGADSRGRRSAGKNLLDTGNKWIRDVTGWLEKYGAAEIVARLCGDRPPVSLVKLFVVARYNAHFSGRADRDKLATWTDWAHFQRGRAQCLGGTVSDLVAAVKKEIATATAELIPESFVVPLPDLAILLNPTEVAENEQHP